MSISKPDRRDTDGTLFLPGPAGSWRASPGVANPDPPVRRDAPRTSKDAARTVKPKAPTQRARVLAWFIKRGSMGGTAEECGIALDMPPQSVTPRINELVNKFGVLVNSGMTRRTSRGCRARVYRAVRGAEGVQR